MLTSKRRFARRAFSFVELLVVIGIVATLFAILLPILNRFREAQAQTQCKDNLKRIGQALINYAGNHNNRLAPMLDYVDPYGANPAWSPFWYTLYPELGQDKLYQQAIGSGAGWGNDVHAAVVPTLLCPSDPTTKQGRCISGATGWAATSYAPVYQLFGSTQTKIPGLDERWITRSRFGPSIPDGSTNQIAIVERFGSFPAFDSSNAAVHPIDVAHWGWNHNGSVYGVWGLPRPQTSARATGANPAHPFCPNSGHEVCIVLQFDGGVRAVSATISRDTWIAVCTPDDGATVIDDW